jgi:hypothetical protein
MKDSFQIAFLAAFSSRGLSMEAASFIQFSAAIYSLREGTDHVDISVRRANDSIEVFL